jgi:hypothetical protein
MDSKFAWTAPNKTYPEFINISLDGDEAVVTVRAAPIFDATDECWVCGQTTTIRLPATEIAALLPKPSPPEVQEEAVTR